MPAFAQALHTLNVTDEPQQALGVYSVVARDGAANDMLDIGQAVPHLDGRGFDILLRALPLDKRLVVRKLTNGEKPESEPPSLARQVEVFERAVIEQCLSESGGSIGVVLKRLNIPRRTLNEKMVRLGIDRRRFAVQRRANGGD